MWVFIVVCSVDTKLVIEAIRWVTNKPKRQNEVVGAHGIVTILFDRGDLHEAPHASRGKFVEYGGLREKGGQAFYQRSKPTRLRVTPIADKSNTHILKHSLMRRGENGN